MTNAHKTPLLLYSHSVSSSYCSDELLHACNMTTIGSRMTIAHYM